LPRRHRGCAAAVRRPARTLLSPRWPLLAPPGPSGVGIAPGDPAAGSPLPAWPASGPPGREPQVGGEQLICLATSATSFDRPDASKRWRASRSHSDPLSLRSKVKPRSRSKASGVPYRRMAWRGKVRR
jgi:hypothetical protein